MVVGGGGGDHFLLLNQASAASLSLFPWYRIHPSVIGGKNNREVKLLILIFPCAPFGSSLQCWAVVVVGRITGWLLPPNSLAFRQHIEEGRVGLGRRWRREREEEDDCSDE